MKKTRSIKKSSKKFIVALMSAMLVMSSLACPVMSYASEPQIVGDNDGLLNLLDSDQQMSENSGTIAVNNGTVETNSGTVETNSGNVVTNNGTIAVNNGSVMTNNSTVEENGINGEVINASTGTVVDNFGAVGGVGTIVNNYAGAVAEGVVVMNNYYQITLMQYDNVTSAFGNDITIKDQKGFILPTQTGTVTFSPNDKYEIVANGATSGIGGNQEGTISYNYGLVKDEITGVWTITLSSLTGSIAIDPEVFNFIVREISINSGNDTSKTNDSSSDNDSDTSSDDSDISDPSTAAVLEVVATPQLIVGGKVYKSTVSGAFITKNITIAVVAPYDDLAKKAGLGAGESLYFKGWDFTAKQSPLAYQSLTDVAGSIGGNVLQCVELNFGKMTFGKFSELNESVVSRTTISLPKKANKNKKHALARAAKGGKTQILENFSEDPNAITSDIPGGAAAYAIVEY